MQGRRSESSFAANGKETYPQLIAVQSRLWGYYLDRSWRLGVQDVNDLTGFLYIYIQVNLKHLITFPIKHVWIHIFEIFCNTILTCIYTTRCSSMSTPRLSDPLLGGIGVSTSRVKGNEPLPLPVSTEHITFWWVQGRANQNQILSRSTDPTSETLRSKSVVLSWWHISLWLKKLGNPPGDKRESLGRNRWETCAVKWRHLWLYKWKKGE